MAKPKKPKLPDDASNPPLNMTDNIDEMYVQASGCMAMSEDRQDLGTLTIVTPTGYYAFIIHEATANEMIQALREWMRGDSNTLID